MWPFVDYSFLLLAPWRGYAKYVAHELMLKKGRTRIPSVGSKTSEAIMQGYARYVGSNVNWGAYDIGVEANEADTLI